ncbi:nucleotide disphospho-sugar-binding domain-containing protein [Streptomyces xanthochromogenes]|uniref:nucleotide disphospho-sugar-binding domain-containing protein n=1 Tax=Streptomyces xanthochromogenes TaxID=67384 RepID=UPI003436C48A
MAHKVPQIVFPKAFGDFLDNARYVADQGAGVLVDRENVTLDELRSLLSRVVGDPSYKAAAEALHEEMLGTPGPNEMVPVLERLVAENRSRAARDRAES